MSTKEPSDTWYSNITETTSFGLLELMRLSFFRACICSSMRQCLVDGWNRGVKFLNQNRPCEAHTRPEKNLERYAEIKPGPRSGPRLLCGPTKNSAFFFFIFKKIKILKYMSVLKYFKTTLGRPMGATCPSYNFFFKFATSSMAEKNEGGAVAPGGVCRPPGATGASSPI